MARGVQDARPLDRAARKAADVCPSAVRVRPDHREPSDVLLDVDVTGRARQRTSLRARRALSFLAFVSDRR